MGARRGIEGLMKPVAVDVDPPQLAGPVASQRRFAEECSALATAVPDLCARNRLAIRN